MFRYTIECESRIFDVTVQDVSDPQPRTTDRIRIPKQRKEDTKLRQQTKEKLGTQMIKNSSLPMWLADIAVDFNPDDPSFYESTLKPVLETRRHVYGWSDFSRYKPQIESLKRFILMNFPAIVSDHLQKELETVNHDVLNIDEKKFLQQIHNYIGKPKELYRLQRHTKQNLRMRHLRDNRVAQKFVEFPLFKPSYTNIVLS